MLYEERSVDDPAQAQAEYGYTTSALMANFASTLTLPQDLPSTTAVVHGGQYLSNWPAEGCERDEAEVSTWYPNPSLHVTSQTSITLIVTDWGEGDIHQFIASMDAVSEYMAAEGSAWSCSGGRTLMFDRVVVVTANESIAAEYRSVTHGVVELSPRPA